LAAGSRCSCGVEQGSHSAFEAPDGGYRGYEYPRKPSNDITKRSWDFRASWDSIRWDLDYLRGKATMAAVAPEQITSVHHWNDTLFSFETTRKDDFRFRNGEFVMVGLEVEEKPLLRAYSIASANHEERLEFFSIKVQHGALTSRLQHLEPGDQVLVSRKPTGSLVIDDLRDGERLFLLGTGTGLAPFLSIIKDPTTYERFEQVILCHGVRYVDELAYRELITDHLPNDQYLGDMIRDKLVYYPSVTRERFHNEGRLTDVIRSGKLFEDLDIPPLDASRDRAMVCGSPTVLAAIRELLNERKFEISPRIGEPGDYVIERAFVER